MLAMLNWSEQGGGDVVHPKPDGPSSDMLITVNNLSLSWNTKNV